MRKRKSDITWEHSGLERDPFRPLGKNRWFIHIFLHATSRLDELHIFDGLRISLRDLKDKQSIVLGRPFFYLRVVRANLEERFEEKIHIN